jgi:hypothetical protein
MGRSSVRPGIQENRFGIAALCNYAALSPIRKLALGRRVGFGVNLALRGQTSGRSGTLFSRKTVIRPGGSAPNLESLRIKG